MSITQTVTALPAAPDPATDTPANFSTKAAAFVLAQTSMVTEINTWAGQANALASSLNALAAGTAVAIPYTFSTTTTDADPGAGYLRLDNATQNAATTIRADLLGSDGVTYTDLIALFDDSTSTIKGQIRLVKTSDATKWLVFNVTALATPSGYRNITVTNAASSAASPFANLDEILLEFTRTGDKGDTGATGATGPAGGGWLAPKTANYTAVSGDWVPCNTSGGAWTLTLPATPSAGNYVKFMDAGGAFATNNLTVARNGSTIEGLSEDVTVSVNGRSGGFVYNGTTWKVYS